MNRLCGADDAFEILAGALGASHWNETSEGLTKMQRQAADALLGIYSSAYFGQTLALSLLRDRVWCGARQKEISAALESCLREIQAGGAPGFDLAWQAACLLYVIAAIDDDVAAAFAERLMNLCPNNDQAMREIAAALGGADGEATLRILEKLRHVKPATREVDRVLARRKERASEMGS